MSIGKSEGMIKHGDILLLEELNVRCNCDDEVQN